MHLAQALSIDFCRPGSLSEGQLVCKIPSFVGAVPSKVPVVVHIDNANISHDLVQFTFHDNPTFTSIAPMTIIPV